MSLPVLQEKIAAQTARIGVIGLGYVGLPVACLFAEAGFDVVGVDVKAERVGAINAGISPIEGREPGLAELLATVIASGRLRAAPTWCLTAGFIESSQVPTTWAKSSSGPAGPSRRGLCRRCRSWFGPWRTWGRARRPTGHGTARRSRHIPRTVDG